MCKSAKAERNWCIQETDEKARVTAEGGEDDGVENG